MEKIRIAIYGAGGYGRELAWLIKASSRPDKEYEFVGFIDDDPSRVRQINGSPVFTLEYVVQTSPDVHIIVAVGNANVRERLAKKVLAAGLAFESFNRQHRLCRLYLDHQYCHWPACCCSFSCDSGT